jgi:hypothetical protein
VNEALQAIPFNVQKLCDALPTVGVGLGKLLLILACKVILGPEFRGTHDHILLSHDSRVVQVHLLQRLRLVVLVLKLAPQHERI